MAYRWAIVIFLAVAGAALMAGPNFGDFLIYLAGILLLGLILRELEKAKRPKRESHRDKE